MTPQLHFSLLAIWCAAAIHLTNAATIDDNAFYPAGLEGMNEVKRPKFSEETSWYLGKRSLPVGDKDREFGSGLGWYAGKRDGRDDLDRSYGSGWYLGKRSPHAEDSSWYLGKRGNWAPGVLWTDNQSNTASGGQEGTVMARPGRATSVLRFGRSVRTSGIKIPNIPSHANLNGNSPYRHMRNQVW